ncbi:protein of unknown function [Moritella yayanosii]|uniref:Uncharacterized protein n=1 Tax=Moritella yayanosii TaxID=69539 RepID=A0A330LIG8_9GAMM|nr:protein of unknown function [Moritella yayanosii]
MPLVYRNFNPTRNAEKKDAFAIHPYYLLMINLTCIIYHFIVQYT